MAVISLIDWCDDTDTMDMVSNIVGVMSSTGALKSKSENVMSCIMHTMPHIWQVCGHKMSGCDVAYTVGMMNQIVAVMYQVKCICCPHTGCGFIYRVCDVIGTVV